MKDRMTIGNQLPEFRLLNIVFTLSFLYLHLPKTAVLLPLAPAANLLIVYLFIRHRYYTYKWLLINAWLLITICLLVIIYFSYHIYNLHITTNDAIWQASRLITNILVLPLYYTYTKNIKQDDRDKIRCSFINSFLWLFSIELFLRLIINPSSAVNSIELVTRQLDVYDVKDENLIYKDTNTIGFVCTFFFAAHLFESDIAEKTRFYFFKISIFSIIVLFTFSRQAYITLIATLFLFYILKNKSLGTIAVKHFRVIVVLILFFIFTTTELILNSGFVEEGAGVFEAGTSLKIDMIAYFRDYIVNGSLIDFIFGWGPQVARQEFVKTYFGHSFLGIIPEFGLFVVLIIYPFFFCNRKLIILLLPFFMSSLYSYYGYVYILPFCLYSILLKQSVSSTSVHPYSAYARL